MKSRRAKIVAKATATRRFAYHREPCSIYCASTAQRIFAITTRLISNQAAVSQDYLFGESVLGTQADY